jgi:hypothetical protein
MNDHPAHWFGGTLIPHCPLKSASAIILLSASATVVTFSDPRGAQSEQASYDSPPLRFTSGYVPLGVQLRGPQVQEIDFCPGLMAVAP